MGFCASARAIQLHYGKRAQSGRRPSGNGSRTGRPANRQASAGRLGQQTDVMAYPESRQVVPSCSS
jgi:hypothetical protein